MGADFHRVVMAAMAAGLLVIPGCGAGGSGPTGSGNGQGTSSTTTPAATAPKIVSATLDGTNSLKLTFSVAMAPSQSVDPTKFRLTIGSYTGTKTVATKKPATDKYTYTYAYSTYYSGAYGEYSRYYADAAPISGILSETSASTEAVLLLGSTFDVTQACQQIAAHGANAGMFLHYSSKGSPTIEDAKGNIMPSVAAFWDNPGGKPVAGDSGPIPVTLACH